MVDDLLCDLLDPWLLIQARGLGAGNPFFHQFNPYPGCLDSKATQVGLLPNLTIQFTWVKARRIGGGGNSHCALGIGEAQCFSYNKSSSLRYRQM